MNATSELPVHGAAKPPAGPESQPKPQPKPNLILSAFIVVAATVIAIVVLKITPLSAPWQQNYDPTGHWLLSTLVAALPVVVLLGTLALGHVKAHYAALGGIGHCAADRDSRLPHAGAAGCDHRGLMAPVMACFPSAGSY